MVAVGRLKLEYAQLGCAEYAARLQHSFPIEIHEIRDVPRRGELDRARAEEARGLRAAVPPGAVLVAMDERGHEWDSPGFATWLGQQRDQSVPAVAFLIGGPDGLDPEVRAAARRVWSLGRLTLPHELARLVLLEQLYRAATILAGLPYHRV